MNKIIVRAIIKEHGKYLLVQRAEETGTGQWQFPGGHTDGQYPPTAVKREVLEETGLRITDLVKYDEFINSITGKLTIFYKAKMSSGTMEYQKSELSAIGWFTLDEMKRMILTPSTIIVVKKMRR